MNAMSSCDDPSGLDENTAAPVTDKAQLWMEELQGHLPGPRASFARLSVEYPTCRASGVLSLRHSGGSDIFHR